MQMHIEFNTSAPGLC